MKSPVLRSICCVVLLALVACGDRSPAPSGHYRVYEFSKGPYKAIGFVGLKSPGLEAAYCEHTNYVNRQVKFFAAALEKDPSSEGAERLFERFEAERDVAETMGQSARFGWLHWFPYVIQRRHPGADQPLRSPRTIGQRHTHQPHGELDLQRRRSAIDRNQLRWDAFGVVGGERV
jgi:hypothetical protein